jgi:hypothetical protein
MGTAFLALRAEAHDRSERLDLARADIDEFAKSCDHPGESLQDHARVLLLEPFWRRANRAALAPGPQGRRDPDRRPLDREHFWASRSIETAFWKKPEVS